MGGHAHFLRKIQKFVIFQKFIFHSIAYDPDMILKTFLTIFDDPEGRGDWGRGGPGPLFPQNCKSIIF